MEAVRAVRDRDGDEYGPESFGPAVPEPRRILCLGVNYREHAIEGGRAVPTWPEAFVRGEGSVLGPYADLVKPALTSRFDYEGELGLVIGAGGRYIPADKAFDAIAGYVILNDATARDWQRAATQWTGGKNFEGTMPIGPEVVTTDEADVSDAALTTTLNGEVRQPPVWLEPGDVIEIAVEGLGAIRNRVVAEDADLSDWRWRPPGSTAIGI
jgi:2-keto-4-pentenoate hydratase/2-oxohepta-3-ene-1,7-dioic acid hydratase in catechol pathway